MARDHARILTAIWADPEWRALTMSAQHAYLTILSQPRLSYCGVLDYLPGRLAVLTEDVTDAKIRAAVKRLAAARFVLVDESTQELLVRSYVRYDGVLDRPNMGKATAVALQRVVSQPIRAALLNELARYHSASPNLTGWIGFKDKAPNDYADLCGIASVMESAEG